jgi:hypothetical protein
MLIIRRLRLWGGLGLFFISYLLWFNCWIFAFIVTAKTLGYFWLTIGMLLAGIGVLPLAFIGVIIQGILSGFGSSFLGDLLIATGLFLVPRIFGGYIVNKHSQSF